MTKIIIYKITNKITSRCYIGLTIRQLKQRFAGHVSGDSYCRYLRDSIKRHGKENFTIEEIYTCFDYEHANEMEDYFIKYYNTLAPNGYNLREGGRYGKMSGESKKLISDLLIERYKNPEAREIQKQGQLKRWSEPKEVERQSNLMRERWKNENCDHYLAGLRAECEKRKKPVVGVNVKTNEIIRFLTVSDAQMQYNNVGACVTGKLKTAAGYCWVYDTGQSDENLMIEIKTKLSTKKSDWINHAGAEKRRENMKRGSAHRFRPIVAVNIETFEVMVYESVHDAIRNGYSTSSIYNSLNCAAVKGQGSCWFYNEVGTDFISLTKERLKKLTI